MSETKHTPGPWSAREPNGPGNGWRAGPAWLGEAPWSDETRANAHLIAAAPDMLAALEAALAYLTMAGTDHAEPTRAILRAVLKKARGEK